MSDVTIYCLGRLWLPACKGTQIYKVVIRKDPKYAGEISEFTRQAIASWLTTNADFRQIIDFAATLDGPCPTCGAPRGIEKIDWSEEDHGLDFDALHYGVSM